jgi:hypothetical protein
VTAIAMLEPGFQARNQLKARRQLAERLAETNYSRTSDFTWRNILFELARFAFGLLIIASLVIFAALLTN